MNRRSFLIFGTVLMFLALLPFIGWPLYKKMTLKKANAALMERTKKAMEKHPELKPDYDRAVEEDGDLSQDKAKELLEKAGETVKSDE